MRDSRRKTTTRSAADDRAGEEREGKSPRAIDSARAGEKRDRSKVGTRRMPAIKELSGTGKSWHDERERMAYERIARSFRSGKRS